MSDRWIKRFMFGTDIGFVLYWLASAARVIPPYDDPVLNAWNWSFLGLDLVAAGTGLLSLGLARRNRPDAAVVRAVSLALTHAAGLLAISFWTLRGDFDPAWWLPNLWLTLFPVAALCPRRRTRVRRARGWPRDAAAAVGRRRPCRTPT